MHEVTLSAPEFGTWQFVAGQSVRLFVGNGLRTYSIWTLSESTLVLRGFSHADGPGSEWMASAAPGTRVALTSPKGVFVVDADAPWHLFVGDDTGAVPLLAMRSSLPSSASVHGIVVSRERMSPDLPWVSSGSLLDAVRSLDLPSTPGVAYVAGEQKACLEVRDHLRNSLGWPRRAVKVSAHWTPGKRGME
ncbi:siderophore-interacting protein [Cryptosporangium sp. NPDC048952]|uniref:siderophore-interacting protein n=1 Tax=Cryptosporangium sp. NPDC048952 TaxID=3363961 RepID=UPI00371C47BF